MTLFAFLQPAHPGLSQLADEVEQTVWISPRTTLLQGRLFGEQLASLVAQTEKVEPVYAIKQIDRIHLLARKDIISEDIRSAFEWLRMNGNAAAHDAREVPVDLALTAHRRLYELAAWYVEAYGSPELAVPDYEMPLRTSSPGADIRADAGQVGLAQAELQHRLEEALRNQVADKLLPSIDERLGQMSELLAKFSQQMNQWAEERPAVQDRAEQADAPSSEAGSIETALTQAAKHGFEPEPPQAAASQAEASQPEPSIGSQSVEIAPYLIGQGLTVVDKRESGGALWIVGGWEIKDELLALKEQRFYFRYAKGGSLSTKRKPAWFLIGNNQTAKRYVQVPAGSKAVRSGAVQVELDFFAEAAPAATAEIAAPAQPAARVQPAATANAAAPAAPAAAVPAAQPASADLQRSSARPDAPAQEDPKVLVPSYLQKRAVAEYRPSRMSEIAETLGVVTFEDWTEERLKQLYRLQPKLLHEVLVQLWFYGVAFAGELSRFVKLERPGEATFVPDLMPGLALGERFPLDIARQLERFGITETGQLSGLPTYGLKWLFRDRYEGVESELFALEARRDEPLPQEEDQLMQDEPESNTARTSRTLYFADVSVTIPAERQETLLEDLPIKGCNALMRGLIHNCQVTRLADLPEDMGSLLPYIKSAGQGAMLKLMHQLKSFVEKEGSGEAPALPARSKQAPPEPKLAPDRDQPADISRRLIWQQIVLDLSDEDLQLPIRPTEFPSGNRVPVRLARRGITRVGELPTVLASLIKGTGIGQISMEAFVVRLVELLEEARALRETAATLEAMSPGERIGFRLRHASAKLAPKLSDEAIRSSRNLQMVRIRWQERAEGRRATLEWLGQQFGLTRERVRQVIRKTLREFHGDLLDLEQELEKACAQQQGFFCFPLQANFIHGIIEQALEEYEGLFYLERYGWWTTVPLEEVETKEAQLRKRLKEPLGGRLWTEEQLRKQVKPLADELGFPLGLVLEMARTGMSRTLDGASFLSSSTKADIAEMVLRQFPQGVEVYKRAEELMEIGNRIRPGEFEKERELTAVFSREEFSDTAYLWGRGVYIHRDKVQIDEALVRGISDHALQLLEKRSPISVHRLFGSYRERLQDNGIPTEYALYTMLRKLGSDQLAPNKFPHIWHVDDGGLQLSNAEQIKMFIREQYEPLPVERLREEFVQKRGWKRFTLEFSISKDPDFVSADYGIVGLREFYPFAPEDFHGVLDRLWAMLQETDILHVSRLYELERSRMQAMGIGSSYLLYDLLTGLDDERFRMFRYPLITLSSHPAEGMTLLAMVEQYMEDQEAQVPREEVYEWVTDDVGASAATLDNALASSKNIFYYRAGQFGEYIHRIRLGWTAEREQELVRDVERALESKERGGRPYATIGELMRELPLGELGAGLPWTEDLLSDCLHKSESFLLVGSYDHIVVRRGHPRIAGETDWLAMLLETEFGGKVDAAAFQHRLAELKYSKEGRFMYETAMKLERNEAPFVVEDGMVYSRQQDRS